MEVEMKDGLQHPVAVMGLPINSLTADEAVETMERLILSGGTHQICPINVDSWLNALADPHLHRIMAGSTLVLPDGQIQTIEGNYENKVAANVRSPTEATGYVNMN